MPTILEAKIKLELNFVGDGRIFLNFWDSIHGEDVCAEFKNDVLFMDIYEEGTDEVTTDTEISLSDFIKKVEKSVLSRTLQ